MKKGFTLIELLGVIIILGIIAVITVPIVQRTILESAEQAYKKQTQSFERAANNYVSADIYKWTKCETISCEVSIAELQDEGYLEAKEIKNPKTDEPIDTSNVVQIYYSNGKFSFKYDKSQDD